MKWEIPENITPPTMGGKYLWADLYLLDHWRIQKNILTDHYRLLDDHNNRRAQGSYQHCLEKLNHFKITLDLKFPSSHIFLILHGLGRHRKSMEKLTQFMNGHGFSAYSLNYPSTFLTLKDHTDNLEYLLNHLEGIDSISFIGHSLGGLIARSLLSRKEGWRKKIEAKHLIMLGTPNNGARIADMMSGSKLFHMIAGPSGQDVRPINVQKLSLPDIPTLVIAGGRGTKTGYNPIFGEDNDGIVTVNETKIDNMSNFKQVNVIHTTIMDHPQSLKAILDFIHQN
ncbi:MAG: GPI inositol-deacylase [Emcibacter sp.]|nr:GPI inositol-deacylase [Emcibacter sp.]